MNITSYGNLPVQSSIWTDPGINYGLLGNRLCHHIDGSLKTLPKHPVYVAGEHLRRVFDAATHAFQFLRQGCVLLDGVISKVFRFLPVAEATSQSDTLKKIEVNIEELEEKLEELFDYESVVEVWRNPGEIAKSFFPAERAVVSSLQHNAFVIKRLISGLLSFVQFNWMDWNVEKCCELQMENRGVVWSLNDLKDLLDDVNINQKKSKFSPISRNWIELVVPDDRDQMRIKVKGWGMYSKRDALFNCCFEKRIIERMLLPSIASPSLEQAFKRLIVMVLSCVGKANKPECKNIREALGKELLTSLLSNSVVKHLDEAIKEFKVRLSQSFSSIDDIVRPQKIEDFIKDQMKTIRNQIEIEKNREKEMNETIHAICLKHAQIVKEIGDSSIEITTTNQSGDLCLGWNVKKIAFDSYSGKNYSTLLFNFSHVKEDDWGLGRFALEKEEEEQMAKMDQSWIRRWVGDHPPAMAILLVLGSMAYAVLEVRLCPNRNQLRV